MTVRWTDTSKSVVTIDTFRVFGFNVAQLRTMVDVLDGSVESLSDGSYQLKFPKTASVPYQRIPFSTQQDVSYILNHTRIRNTAGALMTPEQPGFVFLTRYEYNWASVRDIAAGLGVSIVSVNDDPANGTTEIVVQAPVTPTPTPGPYDPPKPPGSGGSAPQYTPYTPPHTVTPVPPGPTNTPTNTPTATATPTVTPTNTPVTEPTTEAATTTSGIIDGWVIDLDYKDGDKIPAAVGTQPSLKIYAPGASGISDNLFMTIYYCVTQDSSRLGSWNIQEGDAEYLGNNIFEFSKTGGFAFEADRYYDFLVSAGSLDYTIRLYIE
jgi:hypothetical protein